MSGVYGTILADPPWAYAGTSKSERLRGYSDTQYRPLSTVDLCRLPVADLGTDTSVLLLWTTMPFLPDALEVINAWRYTYVTALPWVKTQASDQQKVAYGVGYWMRGAAELLLVGRRTKAYRTQFVGLLGPGLGHSRKPDSVYELAEVFPAPYLELFARRNRIGWTSVGNECPGDGADIRQSLEGLINNGQN